MLVGARTMIAADRYYPGFNIASKQESDANPKRARLRPLLIHVAAVCWLTRFAWTNRYLGMDRWMLGCFPLLTITRSGIVTCRSAALRRQIMRLTREHWTQGRGQAAQVNKEIDITLDSILLLNKNRTRTRKGLGYVLYWFMLLPFVDWLASHGRIVI